MRPSCKIALGIMFWCCVIVVARGGKTRARRGSDASDSARLPVASKAELSLADAADKQRRDEIRAVVNNSLSTESCKNAVMIQVGDGTQCLRDGCATLEGLKDLIHLVQCSDEDYSKLHVVLCVDSDPPCTSPSPETPEKKQDEKRRDEIRAVVNNNLSTESCKDAVMVQVGEGTQCLRDGCATLEGLKDLIHLVQCSDEDYSKLHVVLCVDSDPPCTSPSPETPEKTQDEKRRDEIRAVVNNSLSTESCKDAVMVQVGEGTQCLRDGCATLEGLKDLIHLVQCSDEDYSKLHVVLCVDSDPPCTSPSPETSPAVGRVTTKSPLINSEQAQRNQIRCTMEKQMSSSKCSSLVLDQASENEDLEKGCTTLKSFKDLVLQFGCQQTDYDKLYNVICSWDGTERCLDYVQKQKDAIAINENSLSNSCNKSIYDNIRSKNLTAYCANIKNAKDRLLSTKSCDTSEIGNLTAIVCCKDTQCFEPGVDPSTRKGKVSLAVKALSPRCRSTMTVAIDDFSQPPKEACKALNATKPNLLNGGVCSENDYTSLEEVVCKTDDEGCGAAGECTTFFDPLASERQQIEHIRVVISQLNGTCNKFMTEVGRTGASDPLEKTCKSFLDNHGFIVVGGQCSQGQYDTLKLAICGKGTAGRTKANVVTLIIGAIFVIVKAMG